MQEILCNFKGTLSPKTISYQVTEAWPQGAQKNKYFINWSDCEMTCGTFTDADWEDCIFEGFLNGDPKSSALLVTGCLDEDNSVQIHSEKYGDHIFTTDVFTDEARALVFDEDEFDYEYEDYEE